MVQVGAKSAISGVLLKGRHAQQQQQGRLPICLISAQDVRLYWQTPERSAIER